MIIWNLAAMIKSTLQTLRYATLHYGVNEHVLMLGQFCVCHRINKTDATVETMAPP